MLRFGRQAALLALALAVSGCPKDEEDCGSGQTLCDGICRDAAFFQSDANNCGGCGILCGFGSCVAGTCQCTTGALPCPAGNPRCVDALNDPANCGGCGNDCAVAIPGSGCAGGTCACVAPRDDRCGSSCTDTLTDRQNCGTDAARGCGNACTLVNEECEGGACACPPAFSTRCPDSSPAACANLQTDARNCGTCGNACGRGYLCSGGSCTCPAPRTACPDACVDTATDFQNCGTCGNVCTGNRVCAASACRCPVPQIECGGVCVNSGSDPQNCGGCGVTCPAGQACESGRCACGGAKPLTCGTTCCAGTACCPSGCQLEHSNGLGQTYLDCGALDQHTRAQAELAAQAWSPTGLTVDTLLCGSCLCRPKGTQAAVWCYVGSNAKGLVKVTDSPNCFAAQCPFTGNGVAWH